ncbi:cupin domain-containing protein [Halomonas sp. M5N1S17]|uniref:cupin domain-containing protein n=1 Tax=Halomonas alkalisoli TaxID=2907158 RepID=UPI001F234C27|nr:cupin domain-containing protein [Halomonas alkalisoli]MCE9661963.1 cupin domain-containing protein [Halomonas alkalisoli]
MKRHALPPLTLPLAALTVGALALAVPPLAAGDDPPPIAVQELTQRSAIIDEVSIQITLATEGRDRQVLEVPEPGRVAMAEITVQPGAAFPWHSHPGPVIATIRQGELVYVYADDCVERPYRAGELFIDPGFDNIHSSFNPSEDEVAVVVATFLNAPEGENGQGLTLPREPEQSCPDLPIGAGH